MTYGYIRVSTDDQDTANQRFGIEQFASTQGITIDGWIDETISGAKDYKKRALYPLLQRLKSGDRIIATELSRLGRKLMMVMEILNVCLQREIAIWTIKDNYRLGEDIQSKVLAFAFGIAAEIERNMISQRTKEALARKRAEGVILGRPKGRKSAKVKLTGREEKVRWLLEETGMSYAKAAKLLKVHRITLSKFYQNIKE